MATTTTTTTTTGHKRTREDQLHEAHLEASLVLPADVVAPEDEHMCRAMITQALLATARTNAGRQAQAFVLPDGCLHAAHRITASANRDGNNVPVRYVFDLSLPLDTEIDVSTIIAGCAAINEERFDRLKTLTLFGDKDIRQGIRLFVWSLSAPATLLLRPLLLRRVIVYHERGPIDVATAFKARV